MSGMKTADFYAGHQESAKAERIRKQYIDRKEDKLEQLRRLDGRVKAPGRAAAGILGTLGALIMGSGMSLVMVWGNMEYGLPLGITGMLLAILAYPVYSLITGKRKKRFAGQIMEISSGLMEPEN
ncbi:hypothetical protein [Eisenbergiella sp.]